MGILGEGEGREEEGEEGVRLGTECDRSRRRENELTGSGKGRDGGRKKGK